MNEKNEFEFECDTCDIIFTANWIGHQPMPTCPFCKDNINVSISEH